MSKIYSIWCEWDIGQEGNFFDNEQEAFDFGAKLWDTQTMDEEVGMTLAEAVENGLFSVEEANLR